MKHNRHRLSRFVTARTFGMRAVGAWRRLLPDWTPTPGMLAELDHRPREHRAAVRLLSYGWSYEDGRWDILLALLEWERREERKRRDAADELTRLSEEMDRTGGPIDITGMIIDNVVSMDVEYERLRRNSETTVETKEADIDGQIYLPEDHVASTQARPLPHLRQVHLSQEDVHEDGESVQQGSADGSDEGPTPSSEGREGAGADMVRRPARVLSLREAKAAHAPRGADE